MSVQLLGPEQGRSDTPLPAPVVTFGDQEPLAARAAEHMIVKRPFGKTLAIVEQDLLDQLRIHYENGLEPESAVDHDRLVVEVLRPARDRVSDRAEHKQQERQPPRGRPWHFDYGRV